MATKKVVKKVAEKKVHAPVKEKKVKAVKPTKSSVELVSFGIKATIPVMTFGNIQPEVVVKAKTVEEAQAYALPIIEKLFETYCESPRDGSPKPAFISKANVTVIEKTIPQKTAPASVAPKAPDNLAKEIAETPERTEADLPPSETVTKSAALVKAENAIANAKSLEALYLIEEQVQKSEKIPESEKGIAYTAILKRRKEF